MASKWKRCASCNLSILSSRFSLMYNPKMINIMMTHVAPNVITLIRINLLGVTNN